MTPDQYRYWTATRDALRIKRTDAPLTFTSQDAFELKVAETLLTLDQAVVAGADQWSANTRRADVDAASNRSET
jgi:hypothetical protein